MTYEDQNKTNGQKIAQNYLDESNYKLEIAIKNYLSDKDIEKNEKNN